MQSGIGSRYARALGDIVLAPKSGLDPAAITAQLRAFEQVLAESPDLVAALLTPAVPTVRKRAVVSKLAGTLGLSPVVRNFLFVLLDHRRMPQLSEIREAFERRVNEQSGSIRAEIASARPLDQREIAELEAELARLSGRRILSHFSVDPALLGGALARVGSTVYDGSIRGQLERMRRQFAREAAEYKAEV